MREESKWFSQFVGQDVKLVQLLASMKRRLTQLESDKGFVKDRKSGMRYHDSAPVHLVNQSSIDEVNMLLPDSDGVKFDVASFRPNIVIEGPPAHHEEQWWHVRAGGLSFKRSQLCDRCSVPTVDRDKAVKVPSKSETLRQFRDIRDEYERKNYDGAGLFGIHLIPQTSASISQGMTIDVAFK